MQIQAKTSSEWGWRQKSKITLCCQWSRILLLYPADFEGGAVMVYPRTREDRNRDTDYVNVLTQRHQEITGRLDPEQKKDL